MFLRERGWVDISKALGIGGINSPPTPLLNLQTIQALLFENLIGGSTYIYTQQTEQQTHD